MSVRFIRALARSAGASLLLLACASSASAATVAVQALKPPFEASNSTVTKTPDGVHFGTYADGGVVAGSLRYSGFNGHKLSEVTEFGYTFTYREAGNTTGAAPYARIFLDGDTTTDSMDPTVRNSNDGNPANDVEHDVVLDTSTCGTDVQPQSTDLTFNMNTHTVRYDDDACGTNPQQPFSTVKAQHPNDTIVSMLVSQGNSTGTDVSALLRSMSVNGTTFAFDVAPADGATGPPGPAGAQGAPGAGAAAKTCTGATIRIMHAPLRPGERFLRVNAQLLTPAGFRTLRSLRRTVTLDLRNKPEANYNVRLISRYRVRGSRRVHRVVTRRNFSVACA